MGSALPDYAARSRLLRRLDRPQKMGVNGTRLQLSVHAQSSEFKLRVGPRDGRLQIHKTFRRDGSACALQRRFKQSGVKRRVQKHQVHAGCIKLSERCNAIAAHDLHRAGLKQRLYALELPYQGRVLLNQAHLPGAARSCFKTERTGAGKCINATPSGQVLTEPVEQGFAHAVGRWAQARLISDREPGAPPLSANDANLMSLSGRAAGRSGRLRTGAGCDRSLMFHGASLTRMPDAVVAIACSRAVSSVGYGSFHRME